MDSQPEDKERDASSAYSVSLPVDSVVKVIVKDNGMMACVRITPPQNGGAPPTMDVMLKALNENAIKNMDLMRLKSIAASPCYDEDIVVATGMPSISGADGTVEFLVSINKTGRPKELEDGKVDYYDLGLIENVTKGQTLCNLTLPTDGTPGYTVRGEVLRPKPGKPAPVVAGPNTELAPDGKQILSKIDGQFEFDGHKLSVNETYTLNQDVDTSTGNIKVAGNLVVRGKVSSGLSIEAGGFINVVGVVESGTVKAGKDLNLQGGAVGSTITCVGNLKCRFIENCNVFVRGEMRAEYILNSSVRCKGNLKTEGVISKIIGGTIVVMQNVECRTLGSAAGVKTKLEIGNDPEIIDRQHQLMDLIPELEKQMNSLAPLLKLLNQLEASNRLDNEKALMLDKARKSHSSQSELLQQSKAELEQINSSIFNKNFGKVICSGVMYPGTSVMIGSASYTVTSELMNTSLFYHEGTVVFGSAR